jgi:hypothetical protein
LYQQSRCTCQTVIASEISGRSIGVASHLVSGGTRRGPEANEMVPILGARQGLNSSSGGRIHGLRTEAHRRPSPRHMRRGAASRHRSHGQQLDPLMADVSSRESNYNRMRTLAATKSPPPQSNLNLDIIRLLTSTAGIRTVAGAERTRLARHFVVKSNDCWRSGKFADNKRSLPSELETRLRVQNQASIKIAEYRLGLNSRSEGEL